jgi:hypothetical protein
VFTGCPTFCLRAHRHGEDEGRSFGGGGRIKRGWLPMHWLKEAAAATGNTAEEADGSTVDAVWQEGAGADQRDVHSVEECVRRHYAAAGWSGTYHCENRLFLTLYGLLFWDLRHMALSAPPQFTSAYQDTPHDLCSPRFVPNRKAAVDARLAEIEGGGGPGIVARAWSNHGKHSKYVQWDWRDAAVMPLSRSPVGRAPVVAATTPWHAVAAAVAATTGPGGAGSPRGGGDDENEDVAMLAQQPGDAQAALSTAKAAAMSELVGLCEALGPAALAGLCRLYSESYATWAGGLPDLMIWNEREIRFVEVKGPGDALSNRQRAWIDKLCGWEVAVCVCHVVAVY